ncbi:MAG: rubredoxin-like domain-containing protein [Candidatus Aenigmatarchaeota archaeon]
MYKACRCEVCGEVYLGSEKPEACPFCGAHKPHLEVVEPDEFKAMIPESLDEEEESSLLLDLKEEDFPEISAELMEKVKKNAREAGLPGAYRTLAEEISTDAAEKFFLGLGELEE